MEMEQICNLLGFYEAQIYELPSFQQAHISNVDCTVYLYPCTPLTWYLHNAVMNVIVSGFLSCDFPDHSVS